MTFDDARHCRFAVGELQVLYFADGNRTANEGMFDELVESHVSRFQRSSCVLESPKQAALSIGSPGRLLGSTPHRRSPLQRFDGRPNVPECALRAFCPLCVPDRIESWDRGFDAEQSQGHKC